MTEVSRRCWPRCRRRIRSTVGSARSSSPMVLRRAKTVETLYDHLDFVHGVNAFLTAFPGASTQAIRAGVPRHRRGGQLGADLLGADGLVVVVPDRELPTPSTTSASSTCRDGPMVVETPPMALGTFDDMWFKWIIDFGFPGPDRGAGGKFLLVPPGYDGVAAGRRLLRRALPHEPGPDARPVVHGGQRSRADGGDDQVDAQDLPLHAWWARDQRRHAPQGARAVRGTVGGAGHDLRGGDRARRSTRSRPLTPASSRPSTRCSRTSPPRPVIRRSSDTSPSSASSRASRSRPTNGCEGSSMRPPPSATRPPGR